MIIHEDKTREYLNRWSGASFLERPPFVSDFQDRKKDRKELEDPLNEGLTKRRQSSFMDWQDLRGLENAKKEESLEEVCANSHV